MKSIIAGLLLIAAVPVAWGAGNDSTWVEGNLLQVKFDRLYFGCGLEDRVYPDCRFSALQGRDTVYSGCIEFSYQGVAMSYPTAHFFDSLPPASLKFWIERAAYDTGRSIDLGCVGFLPPATLPSADTTAGTNVSVMPFRSQLELALAYDDGSIDGYFSYRKSTPERRPAVIVSSPAPFFVALVPNVSREVNRGGFLTTSLYYRFDPSRPASYFDGDAVAPYHRLGRTDVDTARPYPYSPSEGRRLLNNLRSRPREVRLAAEHPELASLADYFADILSRDRFRPAVVSELHRADVSLVTVPLGRTQSSSLRHILQLLAADTLDGGWAGQTIRLIDGYLQSAESAPDSTAQQYFLSLAETALRDDLGVLPLFRPTLYFVAQPGLVGPVFDADGAIDLSGLRRIRLPLRKDCRP